MATKLEDFVTDSSKERRKKRISSVSQFLLKTYEILENEQFHSNIVRWADDGKSFMIINKEQFEEKILSKYFKHCSQKSFVRQLHFYDFHKLNRDPQSQQYSHSYFQKGKKELLCFIRRKYSDKNVVVTEEQAKQLKFVAIKKNTNEESKYLLQKKQKLDVQTNENESSNNNNNDVMKNNTKQQQQSSDTNEEDFKNNTNSNSILYSPESNAQKGCYSLQSDQKLDSMKSGPCSGLLPELSGLNIKSSQSLINFQQNNNNNQQNKSLFSPQQLAKDQQLIKGDSGESTQDQSICAGSPIQSQQNQQNQQVSDNNNQQNQQQQPYQQQQIDINLFQNSILPLINNNNSNNIPILIPDANALQLAMINMGLLGQNMGDLIQQQQQQQQFLTNPLITFIQNPLNNFQMGIQGFQGNQIPAFNITQMVQDQMIQQMYQQSLNNNIQNTNNQFIAQTDQSQQQQPNLIYNFNNNNIQQNTVQPNI